MNNINKLPVINQIKLFIKRVRSENDVTESFNHEGKDLNMRDMLKLTRSLNEIDTKLNKKTVYDQNAEEEKIRNFFNDLNVSIKMIDLEIYDNLVFWGGTIDGVIQFVYKVTPDDSNSGVEFNYLKDFSPDNPENDEIVNRVESYYDTFYKYWRNNIIDA